MESNTAGRRREPPQPEHAALEQLPADQRARLVALLHEAHVRQEKQLFRALNHALDFLPAVLRGPVRRLFRSR
jgi:hypothetical protein